MNTLIRIIAIAGLIGAGLVGGIFYAFSSFIMKALERTPASVGIGSMQSINVAVLTPSFLGLFFATAAVSLVAAILAIAHRDLPAAPFLLGGAVLYLVGTFGVTARGNVPLNGQLAGVAASDPAAGPLLNHYLRHWTRLNTLRTAAAATAALAYSLVPLAPGMG